MVKSVRDINTAPIERSRITWGRALPIYDDRFAGALRICGLFVGAAVPAPMIDRAGPRLAGSRMKNVRT